MRSVTTDESQREIYRLVEERREVEQQPEILNSLKGRLPSLEKRRTCLREEIKETKAELAAKENEIEVRDADVKETHENKKELEDRLEELRT